MADLESIISSAIDSSGIRDAETSPDTSGDVDSSADTSTDDNLEVAGSEEVIADPVDDKSADKVDEPVVPEGDNADKPAVDKDGKPVAKPVEKDQLTKDLEELGIKPTKPGERENRLPHSRVAKIAMNYGKKVEARFTAEVGTLKTENAKLKTRSETIDKVDRLIETDPDRYMKMLSTIHPGKYDKFLGNATGVADPAKVPAKVADSKLGPRPQPDVEFEDKTRGYSPEQHDKLLEWVADSARERAISEMDARMEAKYGKIAQKHEADEAYNAQIPHVKAQVAAVYETWGKELVDKHEAEIVAVMEKHPDMSTAEATARVLVPKVRADRNTMRNELINETKKRTAAAARTVPGVVTAGKDDDNAPKSLEDVIRKSIAGLKR